MNVPFIDLKPAAALVKDQVQEAWQRVVANTEFVGGGTVAKLEAALCQAFGVRHAVACANGTDALIVALAALGVGPGKKVALPDLTFWATYEAVVLLGATPVLVDVDEDLQMDPAELRRASDQHRIDAAILVHLMGWASPRTGEMRAFCQERGIALLEDGAQSFGVEIDGRSIYAGAQASTLSFYPAKVIGGCMDGGAVLTDDEAVATVVRQLCNHGRSTHYGHARVGYNSRMGGLSASWLCAMVGHADAIVRSRRALELGYRERLAGIRGARAYGPPPRVAGNGYLSVWTVDEDHAEVAQRLTGEGIATARVYPSAISEQAPAAGAVRVSELKNSRDFCAHVLDLPLYYGMSEAALAHVANAFATALEKR